jgi:hypothetical protein
VVATHLALIGNTAINTQGGGIENLCAFGGAGALVTLSQSFVGGNQSVLGGGIYNDANFGPGGPASISLQAGTIIANNQASSDGGGVYNSATGSLLIAPGVLFLLNSPDNVSDESPGGNS